MSSFPEVAYIFHVVPFGAGQGSIEWMDIYNDQWLRDTPNGVWWWLVGLFRVCCFRVVKLINPFRFVNSVFWLGSWPENGRFDWLSQGKLLLMSLTEPLCSKCGLFVYLLLHRSWRCFGGYSSYYSAPLARLGIYGLWSKHIKGSKERLFIRTQAHNLQILVVIPFVKLQNDTEATVNG